MLKEELDAAVAAFEVGYESASQFRRRYKRLFGQPPVTDVKALSNNRETILSGSPAAIPAADWRGPSQLTINPITLKTPSMSEIALQLLRPECHLPFKMPSDLRSPQT